MDYYYNEKPPRRLTLKGAIAASGLTQRELAAAVGRHEMWVSGVVTGKINPNKFECYRIAATLHAHPETIFGYLYLWDDWTSFADKFAVQYDLPERRRIEPWD